ncbi:DUF501 domain-containing protein [Halanaerobium hydrogeniformans]|uniref:DUF501 domain-containing protein n=1 Tax=Halanaerobium hydrogeniformans TaxID=656519 RepID=E4RJG7_HALHG|nr:DUF501 domain-containing protein [Halanaerobium hydrogeniformans]ADQ15387.1 protein of unknown function DUF501 [Halanaerobium hydrogeniformans]
MLLSEKKIVELQLKRNINNFSKSAVFCPFDFPTVVIVNPYKNNIPAPTIYWLSCPYLNYKVDRLEAESNLLAVLQELLDKDHEFKNRMEKAHKKYAKMRRELLSQEDLNKAKSLSENLYQTLLYSGVGGIKDKEGIKCLHTHLAHFLIDKSNPVGEIAFEKIEWPENCSICQERIDKFASSSN